MDITVPTALKALSTGASATKSISSWWRKSKGDTRALIGELKDNLSYLDMVAEDGIHLGDVVGKISAEEFKRLSKEGFNFNKLKKSKIAKYPSLEGSDLSAWGGKETEELIESIYDKINDLKIRFPHVENNKKYRWNVRVNNIRKRIWLLLRHVGS
jgi:hypothetical protein